MLKSDLGGFNPLSAIALQLKKTSAQLIESIGQKQMAPVGLLTVLSFTGIGWLTRMLKPTRQVLTFPSIVRLTNLTKASCAAPRQLPEQQHNAASIGIF